MDWRELIGALKAAGFTQAQIGEAVGLTQASVSALYRGETADTCYSVGQRLVELHGKVTAECSPQT